MNVFTRNNASLISEIADQYAQAIAAAHKGDHFTAGKHFGYAYGRSMELNGPEFVRAILLSSHLDNALCTVTGAR